MACANCKSNFIDQTYRFTKIIVINDFTQSKSVKQLRRRVLLSVNDTRKKPLLSRKKKKTSIIMKARTIKAQKL